MSAGPTRVYGGVTVPNTPLVKSALAYARSHSTETLYNHAVRSWLFGFVVADKIPALQGRDREAHSVAAILHDLGLDPTNKHTSNDKCFEVDGANAARDFLKKEAGDAYDKHRLQLVWDAIALHATNYIAFHKEPEVVASTYGIHADFSGPDVAMVKGLLSQQEYDAVVKEVPRLGLKDGFGQAMCEQCRTKPEAVQETVAAQWGEKYVEGFVKQKTIDRLEYNLERLE
ncbi:MAG: hypothetical protein Q9166_007127 [cf. Caloplaca sp. 2 TL-2023]